MNRRDFVWAAAGATALARPISRARPSFAAIRRRLDPHRLQAILDAKARELGIVGAQLAVFDGKDLVECATGLAVRERQLAVTTDTLFQIGSTTKLFNAAVVMSLVDDGTLDLDRPVISWIKDFRLADANATKTTTLRHLLSMSSGIDNGPYQDYGRGDDALGRYVASLAEIPQVFDPGTAFGYSNAGINVAGLAAARATGKSWEELLQARILGPTGLEHSATFAEDLLFHPVALGYAFREGSQDPVRVSRWALPRSMAPAGGTLCCSAGDLARFARMILDRGKAASGKQVLTAARIETMQTPQVTLPNRVTAQKWCTGPYWKVWDGQVIYGHSGTNSGGSSMLLWCPAKNFAIATISNVANQGYPLADHVFDVVFPELFGIAKPATPKPNTVTPVEVDLTRYVGTFRSYGSRMTFTVENQRLVARSFAEGAGVSAQPAASSELISLGEDRFLPVNAAMGGNRGWDVAFWGKDGSGRATHYLNGVFAMRRAE